MNFASAKLVTNQAFSADRRIPNPSDHLCCKEAGLLAHLLDLLVPELNGTVSR